MLFRSLLISENFKKNFERTSETANHSITLNSPDNDIHFTPLIDLHYITGVAYDIIPKTGRETLPVLFAIAIVILVIAGINFTNFSTALTPMRIKSINHSLFEISAGYVSRQASGRGGIQCRTQCRKKVRRHSSVCRNSRSREIGRASCRERV